MGGLYKLINISGINLNVSKGDLSTSDINKGASLVGIHDIGDLLDATEVEGALQEIATNLVEYTTETTTQIEEWISVLTEENDEWLVGINEYF